MESLKYDTYGNVILSVPTALEAMLRGHTIADSFVDDAEEVALYNKNATRYLNTNESLFETLSENIPFEEYHKALSECWFMPKEYADLNVEEYIFNKCETEEETSRVVAELELYQKNDLFDLLRFLIYLVDYMREHNIVWGVGRGSSVSSYCLYLIGIHKIDSIKYKLSMDEFLR